MSEPDEFQLRVVPGEKHVFSITSLRVSLRKNVISPPIENFFAAVFTGILAMVCGIISVLARQQSRISRAARDASSAGAEQSTSDESAEA